LANSTITISQIADSASTFGDLAPVLASGGFSDQPALDIANTVVTKMLAGSADGAPFNWKFNRFNTPSFVTISFQQDYFIPGLLNLGWLENCWAVNINQQTNLKAKYEVECVRDLDVTFLQTGYPGKLCWLPNSMLLAGTWGATPLGPTTGNLGGDQGGIGKNLSGLQNPGPNVIYTNPIGLLTQPANATTGIKDPNGNLWVVTTFGTCGATQPVWTNPPSFPTYASPNTVASTVTDGTTVWTAIDPSSQGFRVNPLPPQTGTAWVFQPIGQQRIPVFTSLQQTLEPIPDDYVEYFKQGFYTQCVRRSADSKVRARFTAENALWMKDLSDCVKQSDREKEDYGFYPGTSVMDSNWISGLISRPDRPWGWGN